MVIQNGTNVVLSGVAKARGQEIHPNLAGKGTRWIQAFAFGAGVLKLAAEKYGATELATLADNTSHLLSLTGNRFTGAIATAGYAKDAFGRPTKHTGPSVLDAWAEKVLDLLV